MFILHNFISFYKLYRFSKASDAVASIHLGDSSTTSVSSFTPIQCVILDTSQKDVRIVLPAQTAEVLISSYFNHTTSSSRYMNGSGSGREVGEWKEKGESGGSSGGVRLDVFSKSVVAQRQLSCLSNLGSVQDPNNDAEVRASIFFVSCSCRNHSSSQSTCG